MKILIQEQHIPGKDLFDKLPTALKWGFDGFELRGQGDHALKKRRDELQKVHDAGGYFPTVCPEMSYFIGDFDSEKRADAIVQLCSMLDVIAEFGGSGVMSPSAWGLFSKKLPPFIPPRDEAGDREVMIEALSKVGSHAASLGLQFYLEPLNRYEEHVVNNLSNAASLIEEAGCSAVKIVCDTYHMNIEEADPIASLETALPYLGHVQLSDSNRFEPGAGHIDFASVIDLLKQNGYKGDLAFESQLSGPASEVLPKSAAFVRSLM